MDSKSLYTSLIQSLQILGLKKGDVLLLKGDLTEIGMIDSSPKASLELVFKAIWEVLGGEAEGTIITSSFTEASFIWQKSNMVFDLKSPSKGGGALTKYMLQHPWAIRSSHPTNSFIAIGKYAQELTSGHDENSRPYDPVGKVIEKDGLAISLGSVGNPPDFMTGHFAQQQLGHTKGSVLGLITQIRYRKNDRIKTYRVKEVGGCSKAHFKVYAKYISLKKLRVAHFGQAYSIGMSAKDAFNISYEMQRKTPRSFLCDDPDCFSCRATWLWNLIDWPRYYVRNLSRILGKTIFKASNA